LHLGYHENGRHFEFFEPPKAATHLWWIFLQSFIKFEERNPKKNCNPPFFVSMATAAKFVQPIPIFLAYLVPLDIPSISVRRVTCYDHIFVFQFLSIFGRFHGNGGHF
jgi:hypothetical protein